MGPSLPIPTAFLNQPFWKIATMTPYAAPIESRFMMTALSGTSTDRNTSINNTKLSNRIANSMYGNRDPIVSARSTPTEV